LRGRQEKGRSVGGCPTSPAGAAVAGVSRIEVHASVQVEDEDIIVQLTLTPSGHLVMINSDSVACGYASARGSFNDDRIVRAFASRVAACRRIFLPCLAQ
jgi:hypothetical protein